MVYKRDFMFAMNNVKLLLNKRIKVEMFYMYVQESVRLNRMIGLPMQIVLYKLSGLYNAFKS